MRVLPRPRRCTPPVICDKDLIEHTAEAYRGRPAVSNADVERITDMLLTQLLAGEGIVATHDSLKVIDTEDMRRPAEHDENERAARAEDPAPRSPPSPMRHPLMATLSPHSPDAERWVGGEETPVPFAPVFTSPTGALTDVDGVGADLVGRLLCEQCPLSPPL